MSAEAPVLRASRKGEDVKSRKGLKVYLVLLGLACAGCGVASTATPAARKGSARQAATQASSQTAARPSSGSPVLDRLVEAAIERTSHEVRYDPSYFKIDYPGGDVPAEVGVC